MDEEVPASAGWHQVFGSVALFCFLIQVFTGILLAIDYAPTPGEAYSTDRDRRALERGMDLIDSDSEKSKFWRPILGPALYAFVNLTWALPHSRC